MADNRLTTNILLRYDTYARLMSSDIILAPGEAAVAAFPDPEPNKPIRAFGVKVGDGQRYFDELPWIEGLAIDVYEWAKSPQKPIYQATEIQGLAEYIQTHGGGGSGGGSSANNGAYKIIYDQAANKYILQQWNEENNQWENTASDEINLSGILNRLDTIERWANGARINLGNIEVPLIEYVYDEVMNFINAIDYNDTAIDHQFVTEVTQTDGKIHVTRAPLAANDITSGVFNTTQGGTGLSRVEEDEVLIGDMNGNITVKKFVTEIGTERNTFATTGAIKDYIAQETAGLTGAMHFVGETSILIINNSRVDPQIRNYNFQDAQPGDVILANNAQEYVWTGGEWRLLGDEGSYAIKGSIKNIDIADDANIAQSKIENLSENLSNKVDKVEGKQLSTNDYTTEDKEKVDSVQFGAQANTIEHILLNDTEVPPNAEKAVNLQIPILTEEQLAIIDEADPNLIEHVFVNGAEVSPTTINNQPKSINIQFVMTEQERDKLNSVENGAQVNKIESISFNGGDPITPAANSTNVDITIDPATLSLSVVEGARYPEGQNTYVDIEIDEQTKKLELSHVAATGNIDDLIQTQGTYIIFNCGTSQTVMNS